MLFGAVALAAILGFRYLPVLPAEKQIVPKVASQVEPFRDELPISRTGASEPATKTVKQVAQIGKVTADRRRIFDSPNILATIDDIRQHGTADERDWASYLLHSCVIIFQPVHPPVADESEEAPISQNKPVDKTLEAQKNRAFRSLAEHCKGIKELSVDDRAALRRELLEPAAGDRSVLRELGALASDVRDGRWSEEQAQMITNSLYSGDPEVARQAFHAMLGTMDPNAPGGKDREDAFMLAVAVSSTTCS